MSNHKYSKGNKDEKNYDLNKISSMINNMDKNQIQDILSNLNIDNNVLNESDLNSTGNDRGLLLLNTIKPYLNKDRKKTLEKLEKIYAASRMVGKHI